MAGCPPAWLRALTQVPAGLPGRSSGHLTPQAFTLQPWHAVLHRGRQQAMEGLVHQLREFIRDLAGLVMRSLEVILNRARRIAGG